MATERSSRVLRTIPFVIAFCLICTAAQAKYSGGTGEPNDPYQIATAEDMMLLGDSPEDYHKHFILIADIDMDPNLPGRKVFDRAVIAPDTDQNDEQALFQGPEFAGVFDGNGHKISHLIIIGNDYLGLFGIIYGPGVKISNLGLEAVNINGTGEYIGSLAGENYGSISLSYSTGLVSGNENVGGLVGKNGGHITNSYSNVTVSGEKDIGGLVGYNYWGRITTSYSTGFVIGDQLVGGLVGENIAATISQSYSTSTVSGETIVGGLVGMTGDHSIYSNYSTGTVTGQTIVGGLVGKNYGTSIKSSYSTSTVSGETKVGGLIGKNEYGYIYTCYYAGLVDGVLDVGGLVGDNYDKASATKSFWDIQTSHQNSSDGGTGLTTAEMQTSITFEKAGWGYDANWTIDQGNDYPRLSWENKPGQLIEAELSDFLEGEGTQENPYNIYTLDDINIAVSFYIYGQDMHFRLGFLSGEGTKDNPYLIYTSGEFNLFGTCPLETDKHFKLMADIDLSDIIYSQSVIEKFTGIFDGNGHMICHLTIAGDDYLKVINSNLIGLGLFGELRQKAEVRNLGIVDVNITGPGDFIGGLVGINWGNITSCYSTGTVAGELSVGGLIGWNYCGNINSSYSTCSVTGNNCVGGFVGHNRGGDISSSYSTGTVSGYENFGGFVGGGSLGNTYTCFWDVESSGQSLSDGGTGKTTAEMQKSDTFLEAGWDFIGETENGIEDIWWIYEGNDYPRLWWETE